MWGTEVLPQSQFCHYFNLLNVGDRAHNYELQGTYFIIQYLSHDTGISIQILKCKIRIQHIRYV